MHLTAFIPASYDDYPVALLCAARCGALGWEPVILTTAEDWPCGPPAGAVESDYDRQGWGMFGNWCAYAILRAIDLRAPAGCSVAVKLDADVFVTDQGAEWLVGCSTSGKARCCRLAGHPTHRTAWGGLWAAPRAAVPAMAEYVRLAKACRCPESQLCLVAASRTAGIEVAGDMAAQVWGARDHTRGAAALTLPMGRHRATRHADARRMFDFRG